MTATNVAKSDYVQDESFIVWILKPPNISFVLGLTNMRIFCCCCHLFT